MRLTDLLLEYNRELTAQTYKSKLIQSAKKDPSLDLTDDTSDQEIIDFIMGELEQGDPTPNTIYVRWLTSQYATGNISRLEDAKSTIKDYLELYIKAKQKSLLPIEYKDIMRLNVDQMTQVIDQLRAKIEKPAVQEDRGEYKVLLNDSNLLIVNPHKPT